MARWFRPFLLATIVSSVSLIASAPAGITLVGTGFISGTATDKSGLPGVTCQAGSPLNCVPNAIFGGFGSALAYTGHDDVFIAAPDRGPFDGLTDAPFLDRVHLLHMTTDVAAPFPNIRTELLDTRFLRNEVGERFVGAAGAFDAADERATLRLDPEGIQVGSSGTFYVSDEYGPYIMEFDRQGNLVRRIDVPAKFHIAHPSGEPTAELTANTSGRQANRGMEGLAISPDGGTLFGMMQNALLQDAALIPNTTDRASVNTRILKVDLASGHTREYVYVLDASNRGQGISEILAINDHEFLVVERDNRSLLATPPQAPTRKTIYKIDIASATDVSSITLPAGTLPVGVIPVSKVLFIDLLDPAFGLAPTIAEKIEALAWGPDLADGRHLLYVMSDNDLNMAVATQIYAFAIESHLVQRQPQLLPGPLYPPGQVKKVVR